MRTLNCTQNGNKKFHPAYATVTLFGVTGTIADMYDAARRNKDGSLCDTSNVPDHINVNGRRLDRTYLGKLYATLWFNYLMTHKDLLAELNQYDDFQDGHCHDALNSQAAVFRRIKEIGVANFKKECKVFIDAANAPTDQNSKDENMNSKEDTFNSLKMTALKIVKDGMKSGKNKREIVENIAEDIPNRDIVADLVNIYFDGLNNNITKDYGTKMQAQIKKKFMDTEA
jgi:hypothetical protein